MPKEEIDNNKKDNKNPSNNEFSPAMAVEDEAKNKKDQALTDDQSKYLSFITKRMETARDERNKARPEFDNLTYDLDYESNERAGYSYLPLKRSDDEDEIVTGVTEKKLEVVWNELIATNFQSEIVAHDLDDNELRLLGDDMNDIVLRTNQIEKDNDFWEEWIRELLTQRAVFTEELDVYEPVLNRGFLNMDEMGGVAEFKTDYQVFHYAKKRVISGLQVYLGNINIPFYRFQEQPFVIKYYRKSYSEAEVTYGKWKNWEYVKAGNIQKDDMNPFKFRLNKIAENDVEEIHYIDPYKDEFMIMINGVPMFDKPMPLPYTVTPDRRYNMDMQAIKGISLLFAYGKSLVSSAKTLQGLNTDIIRLMIRKFKQHIEPPAVTSSKKIFSKNIWKAGAVTQGVKAKDLELLNTGNQGLTAGEFNMYQLIENKAEQFITGGIQPSSAKEGGTPTATEVLKENEQFIKNLGLSLLALMRGKRNATYLRLYNLFDNFTKPKKKLYDETTDAFNSVYEKFTFNEAKLSNGKKGKKIVQFMDRDLEEEEISEMFRFEKEEEMKGRQTRVRAINVKKLLGVAINWFVVVLQKERAGSPLQKVMFSDKLTQAVNISKITGKPINSEKVIEEYESTWQTKDMFKTAEVPKQPTEEESMAGDIEKGLSDLEAGSGMENQLKEGAMAGQGVDPSLNTMAGQAI